MCIHRVEFLRREQVTAGMLRVTFGGPGMSDFPTTGVGDEYVRLFLPDLPGLECIPFATSAAGIIPTALNPHRCVPKRFARTGPVKWTSTSSCTTAGWLPHGRPPPAEGTPSACRHTDSPRVAGDAIPTRSCLPPSRMRPDNPIRHR